ncbi:hypothetical protein MJO28_003640 [Puccinia striiformis f. sp. tritici]|uniref:AmmeMemoRadiSam system protein B n=3 Tax=Puccinia striiformis TaxID=27350 RepID=A0A0L0UXF0_9BASI|nr:hypothetical protein Pst134EA_007742 [Puccinia striiformis f. sp. tritici]KAI9610931.1 hypothetical protein H4Q26_008777 [Puccinia striiformis f. sp. tritici PST-130]KNE91723.1 hypothetical protein PSTG_14880 [Puccinia striiformis f. sp. tritici PST-78]POW12317.1 hypothetical protein PSTT_04569 [Puccinia striiformis]KAH9460655.1 hypothetical protein Pst134EB_008820 [Puccinia striiformis f. sp. tritici]KAH9470490.1 hypothetical protein Pst134EA_007742 [Puccinia striiformis f. sp. tritici]
MTTRSATHSGSWYPASKARLESDLDRWLSAAHLKDHEDVDANEPWKLVPMPVPMKDCRAIIAPHAGYSYSGRAAAWAYKLIDPGLIKRVFILGPSHHVYLNCCALSRCTQYETPLGALPIDTTINEELRAKNKFGEMSLQTDEEEHSIELHLPYIRHVFKNQDITIVPILVGSISAVDERAYGAILAPYLADRQNLFVISSDFCHWGTRFSYTHYHDPGSSGAAERLGPHTSTPQYPIHKSIECLDKEALEAISIQDPSHAHETLIAYLKRTKNTICGRHPIGVLLGCMIKLQESSSISQQLQFVRYEQSSQCMTVKDSSVSYASAYLRHPM